MISDIRLSIEIFTKSAKKRLNGALQMQKKNTQYRGLAQVNNWAKLKFAAMNLKKLANWKWRGRIHSLFFILYMPETRLPLNALAGFFDGLNLLFYPNRWVF